MTTHLALTLDSFDHYKPYEYNSNDVGAQRHSKPPGQHAFSRDEACLCWRENVKRFIDEKDWEKMKCRQFSILLGLVLSIGCGQKSPARKNPLTNGSSTNTSARKKPIKQGQPGSGPGDLRVAVESVGGSVEEPSEEFPYANLEVRLIGKKITNEAIQKVIPAIKKYNKPINLNIADTSDAVTPAALKDISQATNLVGLTFYHEQVTDDDLAPVSTLTQLRELTIGSKKITAKGYAHVANLVLIENLDLSGVLNLLGDEHLEHLKNLTHLKRLRLGNGKLTEKGMKCLEKMVGLQNLEIYQATPGAEGLKYLENLKNLEVLSIALTTGMSKNGLQGLGNMSKLKELTLMGPVDDQSVPALKKLTSLKKLHADGWKNGAYAGLADLTNLEELLVRSAGMSDEGAVYLGRLAGLKTLDAGGNNISDEGMKTWKGLTSLTSANLKDNSKISDKGLLNLAHATNLQFLTLESTAVTGSAFEKLTGLQSLEHLNLTACPITEKSLSHLKKFSSLNSIDLTGAKLSDDAIVDLKKVFPQSTIYDYAGDKVSLEPMPEPKFTGENLTNAKPDLIISAQELFALLQENEKQTLEKYRGKVLQVSGKVLELSPDYVDGPGVDLDVGKDFQRISFKVADPAIWTKLAKGQQATLKGRVGTSINLWVIDAVLVKKGDDTSVQVSASELAQAFAKDPEAAEKMYNKKWLKVTGKVLDRQFDSGGRPTLTVEGNDKFVIKAVLEGGTKTQKKKRTSIGNTITIAGEISQTSSDDKIIDLGNVFFIK